LRGMPGKCLVCRIGVTRRERARVLFVCRGGRPAGSSARCHPAPARDPRVRRPDPVSDFRSCAG
jgi:hypothetical protein